MRVLPWTGGLFLMATLAVTGTPPFSIFQSEFTTLSAALAADHGWLAFLFIAGVVTIFAGFLVHMAKMNLGAPRPEPPAPSRGMSRGNSARWCWSPRSVVCSASGCRRRFMRSCNKPLKF